MGVADALGVGVAIAFNKALVVFFEQFIKVAKSPVTKSPEMVLKKFTLTSKGLNTLSSEVAPSMSPNFKSPEVCLDSAVSVKENSDKDRTS